MQVYAHIGAETLADVIKESQRAKALGYDGIALAELKLDPYLASVLGAEHAGDLNVTTSIAVAFPRSPMTTAYMSWALQRFSEGRFQLGLGTQVKGHNVRRFSVAWESPGPRLREYILSLRAIWDCWQNGVPLDFHGKFYNFTLMTPEFNPGPVAHPDIPISISAVNRYVMQLAGEVCQGVHLHGFSTFKYDTEVALPNLEKGAAKSGRSLKDVEVTAGGFLVTGRGDEGIARDIEEVRRRISFYASTRTYKPVMDAHGWGDVTMQLHELSLRGQWQEMTRLITDEIVETFAIVGAYDRIPDLVEKRYGGWANRIMFPMPDDDGASDDMARRAIDTIRQIE